MDTKICIRKQKPKSDVRFVEIETRQYGIKYWVNPAQVTSVNGEMNAFGRTIYSRMFMSDGIKIDVDMKPEDLVKLLKGEE